MSFGTAALAQANVRLRPARPGDAPALFALEHTSFASDRVSLRSWSRLVRSRSAVVALAVDDGAALGAIVVLFRAGSSVARIDSLAVQPAARGQGIAGLLLEYAIDSARREGSSLLRLETRVANRRAQALFTRLGFVEFGRSADHYEDGATAIRYQKYLWDIGRAALAAALRSPHYAQTLDFTCGPSALMMAMAALDLPWCPTGRQRSGSGARRPPSSRRRAMAAAARSGWPRRSCGAASAPPSTHPRRRPSSSTACATRARKRSSNGSRPTFGRTSPELSRSIGRLEHVPRSVGSLTLHVHFGQIDDPDLAELARSAPRMDLAILHDPNDPLPPSNLKTLRHLVEVGKEMTSPSNRSNGAILPA